MIFRCYIAALLCLLPTVAHAAAKTTTATESTAATAPLKFNKSDRVVLLGNTFFEREQSYGYLETELLSRFPELNLTFRNLGWSGDTVWGEARAGFGGPADGFKALKELTLGLKPNVILVAYGTNESFAGPDGLDRFTAGLNTLLDTLAESKATIVLLSPLKQEKMPAPLPDPTVANSNLRLYGDRIKQVAAQRGLRFIDLYSASERHQGKEYRQGAETYYLTDNGVHLTRDGYWLAAGWILDGLGYEPVKAWNVEFKAGSSKPTSVEGTTLSDVKVTRRGVSFTALDERLPPARPSAAYPFGREYSRSLKVEGLPRGRYDVLLDGKPVARGLSSSELSAGVRRFPELDAVTEKVRDLVIAKDRLYFYRWRPQNETYLFGFRKYEQGQNAHEVVLFDPLVESKEKEIDALVKPQPHKYEVVPAGQKK